jgi:hypothetical protein
MTTSRSQVTLDKNDNVNDITCCLQPLLWTWAVILLSNLSTPRPSPPRPLPFTPHPSPHFPLLPSHLTIPIRLKLHLYPPLQPHSPLHPYSPLQPNSPLQPYSPLHPDSRFHPYIRACNHYDSVVETVRTVKNVLDHWRIESIIL